MGKEKYYTPSIEEFHVGFEYEAKERFGDGTVKTQEDFDNAEWIKLPMAECELPYIERMLNGRNAANGLCGVRVKYLDREDIESFKFEHDQTTKDGAYFYFGHLMSDKHYCLNAPNARLSKGEDYTSIYIYDVNDNGNHFEVTIKNKSELSRLLKQLSII